MEFENRDLISEKFSAILLAATTRRKGPSWITSTEIGLERSKCILCSSSKSDLCGIPLIWVDKYADLSFAKEYDFLSWTARCETWQRADQASLGVLMALLISINQICPFASIKTKSIDGSFHLLFLSLIKHTH